MIRIDHFFVLVERFGAATGLAEATISTRLFNDGDRIRMLRSGGDLGARKLAKAWEWLSDNWPTDAKWPAEIPRWVKPATVEAAQ
jgi:hypothetical protein